MNFGREKFFHSVEEALGFKCYTRIGRGGEGRVFRASDTVVKGAGSYALKLYPRIVKKKKIVQPDADGRTEHRTVDVYVRVDANDCIEHMTKTFAQLARIIQEFDSGTVHLSPPLNYFDLHSDPDEPPPSESQSSPAHSAEDSSKQKKAAGTQVEHEEDKLVIQLLESLRRPGFRFHVIGINKDKPDSGGSAPRPKDELRTAPNETCLKNVRPETAIKVHYPHGENPSEGLCCKSCFMAVVMELFDGSLKDVLDYMSQPTEGKTKNQKLEAAAADIRNWPWKVKLHSLCGVLMMREATGDGHGDFKPANILFKTCRNTVWWACLCTLSFILIIFCV